MESQLRLKRIKLVVIVVFIGAACCYIPWHAIEAAFAQQEDRSRFEIIGHETPSKDRFGSDDGAVFVIHFTGDIHGSLEPCG